MAPNRLFHGNLQFNQALTRVERGWPEKKPTSNGSVPLPQIYTTKLSLPHRVLWIDLQWNSRLWISFRIHLHISIIIRSTEGTRINRWPWGGWYTDHPATFRDISERLWSHYCFLKRHWCLKLVLPPHTVIHYICLRMRLHAGKLCNKPFAGLPKWSVAQ